MPRARHDLRQFPPMTKDEPLPAIEAPSLVPALAPALASSPIACSAVEGEHSATTLDEIADEL